MSVHLNCFILFSNLESSYGELSLKYAKHSSINSSPLASFIDHNVIALLVVPFFAQLRLCDVSGCFSICCLYLLIFLRKVTQR